MTWLITGGCGFVGSNLADWMLDHGREVVILDDLSRIGSAENLKWLRSRHGVGWRFVQADVRDATAVEGVVADTRPQSVAHLAGQVAMTTSIENPRFDFELNALGTLNVLEAVRLHSPTSTVLYSSTNKVYGSLHGLKYGETATRYTLKDFPAGLDESVPLDGNSPYGCSKLAADQYVRDYFRIYGIPTVVFRHSSMYGRRQYATYNQGWLSWFCQKAVEMADPTVPPFTISGTGKQVRDVLNASDLILAYVQAAAEITHTAGEVYNIGGGYENSLSLLELFEILAGLTDSRLRFERIEERPGDQKVYIADTSKAARAFHWSPQVGKERGIREVVEWTRERAVAP